MVIVGSLDSFIGFNCGKGRLLALSGAPDATERLACRAVVSVATILGHGYLKFASTQIDHNMRMETSFRW